MRDNVLRQLEDFQKRKVTETSEYLQLTSSPTPTNKKTTATVT